MTDPRIVALDRLDLAFVPRPWAFADARRSDIDAYFAQRQRESSGLWNGRVLLLRGFDFAGGVLRGEFFETNYASFLAWRDWDFPDADVTNCFAAGAVRSRDGAVLLGVMGGHTASPGRVYFPCGTPEPDDVVDNRVDLDGNIAREIAEETGLDVRECEVAPGWRAVFDGRRLALVKILRSAASAEDLRVRARAHIAADPHAELADVRLAGNPADLSSDMPDFVIAFLRDLWRC